MLLTKIAKDERRGKLKTKFSYLTMPNRILFYPKTVKQNK